MNTNSSNKKRDFSIAYLLGIILAWIVAVGWISWQFSGFITRAWHITDDTGFSYILLAVWLAILYGLTKIANSLAAKIIQPAKQLIPTWLLAVISGYFFVAFFFHYSLPITIRYIKYQ